MSMSDCCSGNEMFDLCGPRYGISKEKLKSLIEEICGCNGGESGIDYSYEEQWTGRKWVDGKNIYQMSFKLEGLFKANVEAIISHNIPDLEQVVSCQAICNEPSTSNFLPTPYLGIGVGISISILVNSKSINIKPHQTDRTGPVYVTIKYTCINR